MFPITQTQPQSTTPLPASQPAMPLSLASRGQTVIIRQINGGRSLRQRLIDLGLNQGAEVQILKNEMPHPLIVSVKKDGRLALGRTMTHHILVTPITGET
jgi:ferrous iron transport protein A